MGQSAVLTLPAAPRTAARPTLRGHIAIARFDHWVKNVFVLPGIVVAISIDHALVTPQLGIRIALALLATGLVASSNYTLNELMDAPFDQAHPVKCRRPVPSGQVSFPLAYVQWLVLAACGIALAFTVSVGLAITTTLLWVMGIVYNVAPRSKDMPYADVLSEAINNPLRMGAGWYCTGTAAIIPISLLISYWMVGCYFMALKRFAEYRFIADPTRSAAYRKSFAYYDEPKLLVSIIFYGSAAMLFLGAFIMRYRLELIVAFPLVAWVMATYFSLAFKPDSAAASPEKLYRQPWLMAAVSTCTVAMTLLLFLNVPMLYQIFVPTRVQ